jgi:hypothetical protein
VPKQIMAPQQHFAANQNKSNKSFLAQTNSPNKHATNRKIISSVNSPTKPPTQNPKGQKYTGGNTAVNRSVVNQNQIVRMSSNNKVSVSSNPNLKNATGYTQSNRINRSHERNRSKTNNAHKFSTIQGPNEFDGLGANHPNGVTHETILKPAGKSSMQRFKSSQSKKSTNITSKGTKFKKNYVSDLNTTAQNNQMFGNFINENSQEYIITNT